MSTPARTASSTAAAGDTSTSASAAPAPAAAASASSSSGSGSATAAASASASAVRTPTRPTSEPSAQRISYHIEPAAADGDAQSDAASAAARGTLGCSHYQKSCLIRAPCCPTFYPCRLCHDEDSSRPALLDHAIDRRSIAEMVCMECVRDGRGAGVQPVAQHCQDCGASMAVYYCPTCHLFDGDASHDIFHCGGCGICRRGRQADYWHCDVCVCCYGHGVSRSSHACRPNITAGDCPICMGDLFSGREGATFLRCGHALHLNCARDFFRSTRADQLVCPLCKKSVEEPDDQGELRALIAAHIDAHPMPAEFRGMRARILCNDCLAHTNTQFRFDYNRCQAEGCGSYNTDVIERIMPEAGAEAEAEAPSAAAAAADDDDDEEDEDMDDEDEEEEDEGEEEAGGHEAQQ